MIDGEFSGVEIPQSQEQSFQAPTPEPSVTKTYSPQEVGQIVGRKKKEAYEEGKRAALSELHSRESAPYRPEAETQTPVASGVYMTPEQIRNLVKEETEKMQIETARNTQASQIVSEFVQKLETGKKAYPDFEAKVSQLNLANLGNIVELANATDNTADVIYDLAENPHKVANLMMLAYTAPHLAQMEMQKLSASIRSNKQAASNQPQVNEPLSHVKHSTIAADSGSLSISSLRKQPWLKA